MAAAAAVAAESTVEDAVVAESIAEGVESDPAAYTAAAAAVDTAEGRQRVGIGDIVLQRSP